MNRTYRNGEGGYERLVYVTLLKDTSKGRIIISLNDSADCDLVELIERAERKFDEHPFNNLLT